MVVGWRLRLQTAQLVLAHEEACDGRQHEDFGLLEAAAAAAGLLILETVAAFLRLAVSSS